MATPTAPKLTQPSGNGASDSSLHQLLEATAGTKANKNLISYLEGCFEGCRKARYSVERQWFMNLSFFFGKQWVQWLDPGNIPELARLYEPKAPPWRVRLVVNRIRPIIRTEISKILKEKPTAYVVPASTDESDVLAARAGEQIFEYLWGALDMQPEMWQVQFWRAVCGIGFLKDWWDPNALDTRSAKPGEALKGNICVETISPFHIYIPNLQVWNIERQPYVIHVSAKSPEDVESQFGVKIPPNTTASANVLDSMYISALNLQEQPKDYLAVKEMWMKPCRKYPKGAMFTWTGDQMLAQSDSMPYEHGEYPFTPFYGITSGKFYTDSTIVDLLPLQKELNKTRSQIVENKNQMSRPQLVAQKGSLDPRKITTEPGQTILYQPGFQPPTPLPLRALPDYVVQEIDRILTDFNDISGQHEVSRGSNPTGVTAATALSYLQEQDDTMLAPLIESQENGVKKLGKHFLSHVHQYWDTSHTVAVVGENRQYEVYQFTKKDMGGNTDLNIQAGSAMPRSLAAKQAFILELAKLGLLTADQTLKYLEMAETGKMYEETRINHRQAQRENLKMMDGEQMPANSWDNHQAHIEEHNNFRKMQEFETSEDQIKMLFESHVQLHRQAIGLPPDMNPDQLQQTQDMMAGMPGAGGAGSSPEGDSGAIPPLPGEAAGTSELPPSPDASQAPNPAQQGP